jgi:hypothetical protein
MKLAFPVATPETRDETMLALRGGLEANFDRLAKLGYHGVELWFASRASSTPPGSAAPRAPGRSRSWP